MSESTIKLGDLEVRRLGFGAMRLPGKDIWGEPEDPPRARAVLKRVVELGINFIDSSWYYGPHVANRLIAETLHPYPKDLVIASKLGGKRTPDKGWAAFSRPEELREGCEIDLRELRRDVLDVVHFRYIGAPGPAPEKTAIVAVQNLFNIAGGASQLAKMAHAEVEGPEDVLAACEEKGIAYLPFFPLGAGSLGKPHSAVAAAAEKHRATPAQIAIAWLLARSPVMLPIPGTSSPEHLEENWNARKIALSKDEVEAIARDARA
jgi:aryl-alcohol dehydrogenase-like predicted oxidoreductase